MYRYSSHPQYTMISKDYFLLSHGLKKKILVSASYCLKKNVTEWFLHLMYTCLLFVFCVL